MRTIFLKPGPIPKMLQEFRTTSLWIRIGVIPGVVIFLFLLSRGLAPLHKIKEFSELQYANGEGLLREPGDQYLDPDLAGLYRERAFKGALLDISQEDSIHLVINLYDSTVSLSVKGVHIHNVPIQEIWIDPLLRKLPEREYNLLFSKPLPVIRHNSTIIKEPVVIREAPKDTTEAQMNAFLPDTLIQNPAFLDFQLEHGIRLMIEQSFNPTLRDQWFRLIFRLKAKVEMLSRALYHLITFQKQEYEPRIIINIPADEMRAIYRAVPFSPLVVIYYRER